MKTENQQEIARLQDELAQLRDLLAQCEWAKPCFGGDYFHGRCPVCNLPEHAGHAPTCQLAAALKNP